MQFIVVIQSSYSSLESHNPLEINLPDLVFEKHFLLFIIVENSCAA